MTVYIIEPICHGNGGWCGHEIWKELKTVEDALKENPFWEPVFSPYSGHCINNPRLCLTDDPNDAIYVFQMVDEGYSDAYTWRQL
jgi:hypothetical protein